MFKLDKFVSKSAAEKLRSPNLHKIAAAMARNNGYDVGSELTFGDAISIIGKKVYEKNASYKKIKVGLFAYNDFVNGGTSDE